MATIISIIIFILSVIVEVNLSTYFNRITINKSNISKCISLLNQTESDVSRLQEYLTIVCMKFSSANTSFNYLELHRQLLAISNCYYSLSSDNQKIVVSLRLLHIDSKNKIYNKLNYIGKCLTPIDILILHAMKIYSPANGTLIVNPSLISRLKNEYTSIRGKNKRSVNTNIHIIRYNINDSLEYFNRLYSKHINKFDLMKHLFKV